MCINAQKRKLCWLRERVYGGVWMKTREFWKLLMSLPAPSSCLLPRKVNSSVVGRSSPFTLTGAGFCTFSIMTSVFFWQIFRRTCCSKVLRRNVFSCMCWWVCETSARSSAKSRSYSVEMRDHLMPRDWSSVVRRITRSITMLKNSADIKQPCLTPVLTSKLDLLFCNLHVKLSKKLWMTWTIYCGIP